jgi:hypothetical protein
MRGLATPGAPAERVCLEDCTHESSSKWGAIPERNTLSSLSGNSRRAAPRRATSAASWTNRKNG